jgi:hypothetical protein
MPPAGSTVYLVSCVSQKRERECAARDLYVSDWFCKARRYAERSGVRVVHSVCRVRPRAA